jgi:hypothetical protein
MVGGAISPENRDPLFRIALKNLEFERALKRPKRKPGQKDGHTLLIALQYSQESPENNVLFAIWLADFRAKPAPHQPLSAPSAGYARSLRETRLLPRFRIERRRP